MRCGEHVSHINLRDFGRSVKAGGEFRRFATGALSPDRLFARSSQRRSTPPPTSGEGCAQAECLPRCMHPPRLISRGALTGPDRAGCPRPRRSCSACAGQSPCRREVGGRHPDAGRVLGTGEQILRSAPRLRAPAAITRRLPQEIKPGSGSGSSPLSARSLRGEGPGEGRPQPRTSPRRVQMTMVPQPTQRVTNSAGVSASPR
jgi:hypothetical protein